MKKKLRNEEQYSKKNKKKKRTENDDVAKSYLQRAREIERRGREEWWREKGGWDVVQP